MHLSTILALLATASASLAAPLEARATESWLFESFTRSCNQQDTTCVLSFSIKTGNGPATPCTYTVNGAPASRTSVNGVTCGAYAVTSGWSGQFGENNGFTTWSVTDWSHKQIAWPSYADADLRNGVAVSPDRAFAVQNLP